MKKILLIITVAMICSCENSSVPSSDSEFNTIIIEGCEYLVRTDYSGNVGYGHMAHKGNCNNPIHSK